MKKEEEEFTAKRKQMREVKSNALRKVSKVAQLFASADIKDYIITGSQALIIQGFMFHRTGGDVDVRVCIPKDEERRQLMMQKLQSWAMLYPEEDSSEKYEEPNATWLFTFFVKNTKINVFAMKEEDYENIPFNCLNNGWNVEEVGSVILDKMALKRGKDYEDFVNCISNFNGVTFCRG